MSMIGKTLVHYEITAELGRGGMGEARISNSRLVVRKIKASLPEPDP